MSFERTGEYKCICGKEYTKSQSYYAHLSHCKEYKKLKGRPLDDKRFHTIEKECVCKCGKVFKTNSSYIGHTCYCEIHLGKQRYLENKKKFTDIIVNYNKSYTGEEWYKIHKEGLKKQSKTRKEKYKNGELTPALGVGRGKYSYIIYNNEKIMLRSTYEFIFALWLYLNNKPINVEKIKVPAYRKNKYSNTFISDFNIDNNIYEIKGIASDKDKYIKESFEKAGYIFTILYEDDINKLKNEIKDKFNIDNEIKKIIEGHNNKQYYVLNLDKL